MTAPDGVPADLPAAARWYAEHGFKIHPLRPRTQVPAWKDWPRRATSDLEVVDAWWAGEPASNIGVLVGNGLVVIDVDVKNDPEGVSGIKSLIDFVDSTGIDLSEAVVEWTPTGGAHLWLRVDVPVSTRIGWLHDVDLLADGGRTVTVTPSVRPVGGAEKAYTIKRGTFAAIRSASRSLVEAMRFRPELAKNGGSWGVGESALAGRSTELLRRDGFRRGERDQGLYALACRLWRYHWPHEDLVRAVIHDAWAASDEGGDPFPWAVAEQKISRAREYVEPQILAERRWIEGLTGGEEQ